MNQMDAQSGRFSIKMERFSGAVTGHHGISLEIHLQTSLCDLHSGEAPT